VEIKDHLLKRAGRAAQVVFVSNAESGANVDVGFFNRDLVQGRKLRQLG
jgi:hypothetical protein